MKTYLFTLVEGNSNRLGKLFWGCLRVLSEDADIRSCLLIAFVLDDRSVSMSLMLDSLLLMLNSLLLMLDSLSSILASLS